jgi:oxygen-dependent protoporphyrinogen oxidase
MLLVVLALLGTVLQRAHSWTMCTGSSRTTTVRLGLTMADAGSASSTASTISTDCLVIGAGISGSTLAHNLHRNGVDMLLTEARDYVGGNVISKSNDAGFLWEEGPNSFATQPSIVRIAYELGIADQLVFADESLPPWVNHNGKLHPLPKGKGGKGPKGQLELVFGSNGVLAFGLAGNLLSWPGKSLYVL